MPPGPFIILSEVDSTNNYAMAKLHAGQVQSGSCFQAVEQTAGRGQRGREWVARKGQNITMSMCVKPVHHAFPFLLSASMALGCYKFIKECGLGAVTVKWPNDVYVGDRKTAGMLIENIVRGSSWDWAVIGIGLNVNQEEFGASQGRATSLKKALGRSFDVPAMAKQLHRSLSGRLEWMKTVSAARIMEEYNDALFLRGQEVRLKKASAVFTTTIESVTPYGELVTRDAVERRFSVGEVEFVLPDALSGQPFTAGS